MSGTVTIPIADWAEILGALRKLVADPVVKVAAEDEERFAEILDAAHAALARAEW